VEGGNHKAVLHLTYHLKIHYNSVRREDDPVKVGVPPFKDYAIGNGLTPGGGNEVAQVVDQAEQLQQVKLNAIQLIKKTCEKTAKSDLVIMRRALESTFHPGLKDVSIL